MAPDAAMRANSVSMSSTTKAISMPWPAGPAMDSGLNVPRPVRRKITLIPVSGWVRDTKPSSDMASVKPKWVFANSAEASVSATFRDRAVPVILMVTSKMGRPRLVNIMQCIKLYRCRSILNPFGGAGWFAS